MPPRQGRKPRPRRARSARTPKPVEPTPGRPVARVGLLEPPHSHIVCRSCGRISRLELQDAERQLLVALAAQHPAGWGVDGISFSLTGFCVHCREGRRT